MVPVDFFCFDIFYGYTVLQTEVTLAFTAVCVINISLQWDFNSLQSFVLIFKNYSQLRL